MPKLQEFRDAHYANTDKVSNNVRAMAIAALGIIWIFKKQIGNDYQIPKGLYFPTMLIFIAMALDFFQYLVGAMTWQIFFRRKEKEGIDEKKEIYAPPSLNYFTYILFYCKSIILMFGYYFLISFLFGQVKWG